MAYKLVAFACLVAAASAGLLPVAHYGAPVAKYVTAPLEHYAPAEYNFQYGVHDAHTGDVKSQQEQRHGDDVQGSYSLVEADGTTRIVDYTASEKDGFNAVVRHEGHPAPAPAHVAKVAYAAPLQHYAAPVAKLAYQAPVQHYAAPVAKVAYAAPVQHYAAPVQHYAAPVQHYAAPVQHYAAPVQHYAAPVAKVAYGAPVAKVAYAAPVASVSFSSPIASYHH